jgi:hypothetical protein
MNATASHQRACDRRRIYSVSLRLGVAAWMSRWAVRLTSLAASCRMRMLSHGTQRSRGATNPNAPAAHRIGRSNEEGCELWITCAHFELPLPVWAQHRHLGSASLAHLCRTTSMTCWQPCLIQSCTRFALNVCRPSVSAVSYSRERSPLVCGQSAQCCPVVRSLHVIQHPEAQYRL